jgi:hypothetical protein
MGWMGWREPWHTPPESRVRVWWRVGASKSGVLFHVLNSTNGCQHCQPVAVVGCGGACARNTPVFVTTPVCGCCIARASHGAA